MGAVSEELSSVETPLPLKNPHSPFRFQKNLVVWKRGFNFIRPIKIENVSEELSSVETKIKEEIKNGIK